MFYLGVSVGGILSVLMFVTCFQRKQYFMFVLMNSVYAILTANDYVLIQLQNKYGIEDPGLIISILSDPGSPW